MLLIFDKMSVYPFKYNHPALFNMPGTPILGIVLILKPNFSHRLRQEMEIKLKKEEEDRQLRRKRVEAIMLRTRNQGKGNASTKVRIHPS